MPQFPSSPTGPRFVAAVVGVVATAAVAFSAGLTSGQPTPELAVGVLLAVTLPTTVAYELARRGRR